MFKLLHRGEVLTHSVLGSRDLGIYSSSLDRRVRKCGYYLLSLYSPSAGIPGASDGGRCLFAYVVQKSWWAQTRHFYFCRAEGAVTMPWK